MSKTTRVYFGVLHNLWVLKSRDKSAKCESSNVPFMDSNIHLDNDILDFMTRLSLTVFEMIEEDHCVYLKHSKKSVLILSLYVDDILITGNYMDSIVTTKKWLSSTFEIKDMSEAHFVLGIEIVRDRSKKLLGLSQETYIKKILEQFHIENSKPIDTPVEKGSALCLD